MPGSSRGQPDLMEKNETADDGTGPRKGIDYKWVVLSITTIEMFMVSVNGSITLISLPAIFNGINIDPLTSFQYLIWVLMGYSLVTATLLLSCGRLSDMYGRVKLYNLGFAIFTLGSILLFLTPDKGSAGALEIIAFRLVQGVGASFTFSNSAAILTDAFPPDERGKALGLNTISFLSGQFVGLILGGILAFYNWRYVFLVSVPVGILGTVWAYLKLRETPLPKRARKIDVWGNITFVAGLTILLIGITYALLPYGNGPDGMGQPVGSCRDRYRHHPPDRIPDHRKQGRGPDVPAEPFKIRVFSLANTAGFLSALARGGMMFILILMLQGIWLPLHGYSLRIHTVLGRDIHAAAHRRLCDHGPPLGLALRQIRFPLVRHVRPAPYRPLVFDAGHAAL